jgi:hypothetical protein
VSENVSAAVANQARATGAHHERTTKRTPQKY